MWAIQHCCRLISLVQSVLSWLAILCGFLTSSLSPQADSCHYQIFPICQSNPFPPFRKGACLLSCLWSTNSVSDIKWRYMVNSVLVFLLVPYHAVTLEIMFGCCPLGCWCKGHASYIAAWYWVMHVPLQHVIRYLVYVPHLFGKEAMLLLINVNLIKQEFCLRKSWP
jgi:hypothetical protein